MYFILWYIFSCCTSSGTNYFSFQSDLSGTECSSVLCHNVPSFFCSLYQYIQTRLSQTSSLDWCFYCNSHIHPLLSPNFHCQAFKSSVSLASERMKSISRWQGHSVLLSQPNVCCTLFWTRNSLLSESCVKHSSWQRKVWWWHAEMKCLVIFITSGSTNQRKF